MCLPFALDDSAGLQTILRGFWYPPMVKNRLLTGCWRHGSAAKDTWAPSNHSGWLQLWRNPAPLPLWALHSHTHPCTDTRTHAHTIKVFKKNYSLLYHVCKALVSILVSEESRTSLKSVMDKGGEPGGWGRTARELGGFEVILPHLCTIAWCYCNIFSA